MDKIREFAKKKRNVEVLLDSPEEIQLSVKTRKALKQFTIYDLKDKIHVVYTNSTKDEYTIAAEYFDSEEILLKFITKEIRK